MVMEQFKQRERVVIIDPAQTYYISPLLQFAEAKELHAQQAELAMHGDRVVARLVRVGADGRAEGEIVRVLKREGYVGDYVVEGSVKKTLRIFLKYGSDGEPLPVASLPFLATW